MRLHPVAAWALALLVTAVCLAAGFWQLGRLAEKRERNARLRAVLAAPAESLASSPGGLARQEGRKVVASGVYDPTRHVLLSARFRDGELGVEVVTPLLTSGSGALLVNRGWLRAEDGRSAHPESFPEPGVRTVTGVLARVPAREGSPPWQRLEGAGAERWSTHELDSASVLAHLPYPPATRVLVALPEPGAPREPARSGPPLLDEQVHLSYAFQWFAFAAVTVVGSLALALRGRLRRTPPGGARA